MFCDLVDSFLDLDFYLENNEYRLSRDINEALKENCTTALHIKLQATQYFNKTKLFDQPGIILEVDNDKGIEIRATKRARTFYSELLKNFNELSSTNSEHKYTDEKIEFFSEQYRANHKEYKELEKAILSQVKEKAVEFCDVIFSCSNIISEIDCFLSLSKLVTESAGEYVKPILLEKNGSFKIFNARHPALDVMEDVDVIANDINLKKNSARPKMCIITGPNMGGKSTFIKTVALLSVMTQIGSYIPASENSEIPIVDKILARIGANDKPQHGISTFMAEMIDTSNILRSATENSLVIIDELGRGTSTFDGFGLCASVSRELIERNCFCFQATHFQEIAMIEQEFQEKVCMKQVGVILDDCFDEQGNSHENDENLKMPIFTYTLEDGVSKGSFGINCAKIAGLPHNVVTNAARNSKTMDKVSRAIQLFDYFELDNFEKILKDSNLSNSEKKQQIFEKLGPEVAAVLSG